MLTYILKLKTYKISIYLC